MIAFLLAASILPAHSEAPRPQNLISNSSFELGLIKEWWGVMRPNIFLDYENITAAEAVHGKRSLTVEGEIHFFSRYIKFEQAGEYRFRFFVKAESDSSIYVSFRAPPPPSADPKTAKEKTLFRKSVPVGSNWTRQEVTAPLGEGSFSLLISTVPAKKDTRFWLDAFDLSAISIATVPDELGKEDEDEVADDDEELFDEDDERKQDVSSFVTAFPVEAGLISEIPGHIFYRNEDNRAKLNYFNNSKTEQPASIQYELRNLEDKLVRTGRTKPLDVPSGKLVSQSFPVPSNVNGLFSLQYRLAEKPKATGEFVYSVIEKPTAMTILGAHTYGDRFHLSVLRRAGVRTYVSLTDLFLRSSNVHPEPEKYVWDDARAKRIVDHGMKAIGVLEHGMFAGWGERVSLKQDAPVLMRHGYFLDRDYVRYDLWEQHVRTIVSHYKDTFRRWIIDDEINAVWDAKSYLSILQRTKKIVKEIDPDIQVTTSADVHFFERLIEYGGMDSFDAICGSIGNVSYWEKRKTRFLSEKYNKPVWVNALFGYGRTAYRSHAGPGWLDRSNRALGMYKHMIRNFFVQRATYVSPYIFRLTKFSTTRVMEHSLLDYDGGLKPNGFGFIHAGTQLAALVEENLGALAMKNGAPLELYAFKGRGRAGVVLMNRNGAAEFWFLEGMEVTDWLGTPKELLATEQGRVSLSLPGGPKLVTVPATKAEQFFELMRQARFIEPDAPGGLKIEARFGYRNGGLVVEKTLTNLTGKKMKVTVGDDKAKELKPGDSTVQFESISWRADRPFENYMLPNRKRLWLHNCLKRSKPFRLDGDFADWDDRSSSWILMTWDILAFYSRRYLQLVDGGEHMSYDTRRDCKVGFRSAWDEENVYFAISVTDESVPRDGKEKDRVVLKFLGAANREVVCGPNFPLTPFPPGFKFASKRTKAGYQIEIEIPKPVTGSPLHRVIPFDLYIHDIDKDENYKGDEKYRWSKTVMRWAGGSNDGGQLIFWESYQPR